MGEDNKDKKQYDEKRQKQERGSRLGNPEHRKPRAQEDFYTRSEDRSEPDEGGITTEYREASRVERRGRSKAAMAVIIIAVIAVVALAALAVTGFFAAEPVTEASVIEAARAEAGRFAAYDAEAVFLEDLDELKQEQPVVYRNAAPGMWRVTFSSQQESLIMIYDPASGVVDRFEVANLQLA